MRVKWQAAVPSGRAGDVTMLCPDDQLGPNDQLPEDPDSSALPG